MFLFMVNRDEYSARSKELFPDGGVWLTLLIVLTDSREAPNSKWHTVPKRFLIVLLALGPSVTTWKHLVTKVFGLHGVYMTQNYKNMKTVSSRDIFILSAGLKDKQREVSRCMVLRWERVLHWLKSFLNLYNADSTGYVGCAICLERKGKGEFVESDTHPWLFVPQWQITAKEKHPLLLNRPDLDVIKLHLLETSLIMYCSQNAPDSSREISCK